MQRNACLILAGLLAAGTSVASAQGRDRGLVAVNGTPSRVGFFITGGLGDGLDQYKDAGYPKYSDWLSSPAGVIRLGGAVNQNVRLGAEVFGWRHSYYDAGYGENLSENFSAFLFEMQFYPAATSGFYLKGGIGVAHSGTTYELEGQSGGNGFAFSGGAGYDIPVSRSVSIAPMVDFYQSHFSNGLDPSSDNGYSYTEHVLNVGVSITFQAARRYYR